MKNKNTIEGEVLDKDYPLRTTDGIYNFYLVRAGEKGISVNAMINVALLKYKKQLSKPKK
jgi:hypothetical protein